MAAIIQYLSTEKAKVIMKDLRDAADQAWTPTV
jgi:hypothetical protein